VPAEGQEGQGTKNARVVNNCAGESSIFQGRARDCARGNHTGHAWTVCEPRKIVQQNQPFPPPSLRRSGSFAKKGRWSQGRAEQARNDRGARKKEKGGRRIHGHGADSRTQSEPLIIGKKVAKRKTVERFLSRGSKRSGEARNRN